MVNAVLSYCLRRLGGTPCFRIHGKAKVEADWRIIDVFATQRRNLESRWPFWRGTCITWTDRVVVVGWDFAESVLREQRERPASRDLPVEVVGGRIRDGTRRAVSGGPSFAAASEILAHECGHTYQAICLGPAYLPLVGSVTLFQEGPRWWNHFENRASEDGMFGGIVNGSVAGELLDRMTER